MFSGVVAGQRVLVSEKENEGVLGWCSSGFGGRIWWGLRWRELTGATGLKR
uniref:Uncharacterized protein n=1 Tax=Solanum tuberosum TaxID=4113 RepID=M1CIY8_SOLTU